MSVRLFRFGGIEIPLFAGLQLSQTYAPIGGYALIRMLDGAGVKQQHWEKLSTTIRGTGMFPAGLDSVDYCSPYVMQCVGYREATSTLNVMEVTQKRRTDEGHVARGFYLLDPIGAWQRGTIQSSVASVTRLGYDDVTVTPVTGALAYRVKYLPEITVFAEHPNEDDDVRGAEHSWVLSAEEV